MSKRSGQPFRYDILKDHTFVYDTEPASRAVVTVRMIEPEKELAFFKAVQTAFYAESKKTDKIETYIEIAKNLGIDSTKFKELFDSEEARFATKLDFQISSEMGVKGFPSVVIKTKGQFFMISNGYREVSDLEKVYQNVQNQLAE